MTAEWHDSRWPRAVNTILNILRPKAVHEGTLRLCLDEPQTLGRLTLKKQDGQILYYLIDSANTKEKLFYLPSALADEGFLLQDEKNKTLFAWNVQEPLSSVSSESPEQEQVLEPENEGGKTL